MDLRTILLFGMPRSGTTWLGKVFDSHPRSLYRHEPDSFGTLDAMPLFPDVARAAQYQALVGNFVSALPATRSARVTGKLPLFPKDYQGPLAFQLRRLLLLTGKFASRMGMGQVPLPPMIDRHYGDRAYLVWKSIESLGRLGVIARLLPGCHAVHILRHPCGYVASVLRGEAQGRLGGDVPASEDYGIFELLLHTEAARAYGLTLDALRAMQPVERLAWRWVLYNEKAMADTDDLEACTRVRYEDLCTQPLEGYRRLFAATELPWDIQTERFVQRSTGSNSDSYYSVFRDPALAARGWREQLAREDIERILRITRASRAGALYGD